ncbi:putative hit finger domain protein [Botrytis fragariae]|uniref:Putative hit finger domain protein n=1 Tax=Botrytis fragariae TaxID=1964551 RepID=A0A8H6EKC2_9HELO|nr:putative hit finger domain protein [Botrytis fragariae]KAF5875432.1 putative hit finger domain protein [Botrytis fragariae]
MNFGVLEIAPSKYVPAPGYAYVPDVSNTPQVGLQPSARRARGPAGAGLGAETTKKQDAKILRELAQLDRENHRDVNIPVTGGGRGKEGGRGNQSKLTPSVRKILASQKTFANHLSDFEALSSLPTSTSTATVQPATPTISTPKVPPAPGFTSTGKRSHKRKEPLPPGIELPKRSHKKKDPNAPAISTPLRTISTPIVKSEPAAMISTPAISTPAESTFAPFLCSLPPPKPHPRDNDPLLVSRVPNLPSVEEMQRLLEMPPLSYIEARGGWTDEDRRKPGRVFCEVCGYWGRVKCMRCGGRVCALECLGTHKEECFNRYGA